MKYLFFILVIFSAVVLYSCGEPEKKVPEQVSSVPENMELEYRVRESAQSEGKPPVLVLLHRYGRNPSDLFNIFQTIPGNWLVVSIRAPLKMNANQFKWYAIDKVDGVNTMNFPDADGSRKLLLAEIDRIIQKYNADKDRVVVTGFSQGGNMAIALTLTAPEKIFAAGCFSCRLITEFIPMMKNEEALEGKPIFIAHGTEDQTLPFSFAEENKAFMEKMGAEVTFFSEAIKHSFTSNELEAFTEWLNGLP